MHLVHVHRTRLFIALRENLRLDLDSVVIGWQAIVNIT
jgi:hypothetical protein